MISSLLLLIISIAMTLGLAIASIIVLKYCTRAVFVICIPEARSELSKLYKFAFRRLWLAIYVLAVLMIVSIIHFLLLRYIVFEVVYVTLMALAGAELLRLLFKFNYTVNIISELADKEDTDRSS